MVRLDRSFKGPILDTRVTHRRSYIRHEDSTTRILLCRASVSLFHSLLVRLLGLEKTIAHLKQSLLLWPFRLQNPQRGWLDRSGWQERGGGVFVWVVGGQVVVWGRRHEGVGRGRGHRLSV